MSISLLFKRKMFRNCLIAVGKNKYKKTEFFFFFLNKSRKTTLDTTLSLVSLSNGIYD